MKKLVRAVAIITIFAVITRALGFILRIYMSRKLGAETLGYYQVAITVFGVLCTIISSGIPVIVSRSVASAYSNKNSVKQNSIVSSGLFISGVAAAFLCGIIFLFPSSIDYIFTSRSSVRILIWLLPGVLASAIYATFRGALWGQKRFFWISCSEFIEQIVRIIFIVILFEMLSSLAPLGELAAISLSAACVISAIVVAVLYFCYGGKLTNPFGSFAPVIKASSPITTIRTASSLGTFLIAIIIPLRLVASGMPQEKAMSLFGIASGMALPLIMIPSTFVGAIATAVIPDISENYMDRSSLANVQNFDLIRRRMNSALSVTLVVSFICVPIYFCLGPQLGVFLFNSKEAGIYVSRASILMVPICLSQISTSFLNAVGMEYRSLMYYAAGSVLMFLSIYFLPPIMGINSLIVGLGALFTTTTILNISYLGKKRLLSRKHIFTCFALFAYCIPTMLIAKYVYILLSSFLPLSVSLVAAFGLSAACFIGLCLAFHQLEFQFFFSRRKAKKQV